MQTDTLRLQQKRQLRLGIARLRRRIDGRAYAVSRESRRLISWKTYVRRSPGYALLAASGIGLIIGAASSGAGPKIARMFGRQLVLGGLGQFGAALRGDLAGVWNAFKRQQGDDAGASDV